MLNIKERAFNYGMFFFLCLMGLIQDFIGKDQYLKNVDNYWINMPWFLWLIPMSFIIWRYISLK